MNVTWDTAIENRFQTKIDHESSQTYRGLFKIVIPFFSTFVLVDIFAQPREFLPALLVIRAIAIAILIFTYFKIKDPNPPQWIPASFICALGGALIFFACFSQGYLSPYFYGMGLMTFVISNLFPWGPRRIAKWCIGLSFAYLLSVSFAAHFHFDDPTAVANNIAFLGGSSMISIWGAWISDHLRRESFKQFLEVESQQAVNQKVVHALNSRDEFLTIASHELITPITSLKMQLQITRRSIDFEKGVVPTADQLQKAFDVSIRQTNRLAQLVEDMLDVSRMQTGKMKFEMSTVPLVALVQGVVDRSMNELTSAKCEVKIDAPVEVIGNWDGSRIEQVLVNLISNAVKYAPGSKIIIRVTQDDTSALISFQDNGPGIPKDKQPVIFNRYERATSYRNVSGLGLGLYICRQIVEAHGGNIGVESHEGKGTTFNIELPLRVDEEHQQKGISFDR